jgi:transcriptional regulator with XRE-family HTH domain
MTAQETIRLGKRIKTQREECGFSLNALAETTGISKGYLSQLERGEASNPSVEVLRKIAAGLGVSVSRLLGEEEATDAAALPLPSGLKKFVEQSAARGKPVAAEMIDILARMSRRGRQPKSPEDWAFLHDFIKRYF